MAIAAGVGDCDRLAIKVDLVMKKALKPKIGEQILQELIYL